ncbi:hypothetical protein M7I_1874 [Glarea lozoyensis 74030]|uniref:Uncharacterized protein n=1 Tax=Glarea lozoyensis (strain ATCC 74030 / MF5533) TaxID=1104152 RepID=H0EH97_GLAL7|nr:hypothetical protein M7I_1874 [Glarea lozoyensis 74030]
MTARPTAFRTGLEELQRMKLSWTFSKPTPVFGS